MFEGRSTEQLPTEKLLAARGGVSFPAVLTGVVVSIGTFFLLSAIVGGILAVSGIEAEDLTSGADAGIGAGIALIVAFFLAYMWGGYTAGRMGRGAGLTNGLLVPFVALIIGAIVGAIVWALGTTAELNLPFSSNRLPLEDDYVVDWTIGLGAATLIAMFLGGIVGGMLGARWHTKLERRVVTEYEERRAEDPQTIDVTDRDVYTAEETPETQPMPARPYIERHPSRARHSAPPPPPPAPGEHQPTREFPPR
jgi:hypothetical protein